MKFNKPFAIAGTIQGIGLWWMWHAVSEKVWPATDPHVFFAFLWPMLAVPLALYWTEAIPGLSLKHRARLLFGVAVLFAGLGFYEAWSSEVSLIGSWRGDSPWRSSMAVAVLLFVGVHLMACHRWPRGGWNYPDLFEYTWRNGVLTSTASSMLGAFWCILFAGAGLLKLVGVEWVWETITKSWFAYPASGVVLAAAFALGIRRAGMAMTIRKFLLSIMSWLLPLVLLFAVVWSVVMPVMGLDKLFKTGHAAFMMLWFAALAIKFVNCAYQDGEQGDPYPAWLSRVTQWAWLGMLPVVVVALWALGLRIQQYGWSVGRIWGLWVAVVGALYVLGYLCSLRDRSRWMAAISRSNIVASVILCVGTLILLSPLADSRRLAFASQISKYDPASKEKSAQPDWRFLSYETGRYGREQLREWSEGKGLPVEHPWIALSKGALSQRETHQQADVDISADTLPSKLVPHPKGKKLPPDFVAQVLREKDDWRWKQCFKDVCHIWVGDLDSDGQDELVVFATLGVDSVVDSSGNLYAHRGEKWVPLGAVSTVDRSTASPRFEARALDEASAEIPKYKDLVIGGRRLYWSRW
ncbi:MAG: hypothetical protein RLZZ271_128 [Pseudomonadota bacterium]|jgi:hypothetical protein